MQGKSTREELTEEQIKSLCLKKRDHFDDLTAEDIALLKQARIEQQKLVNDSHLYARLAKEAREAGNEEEADKYSHQCSAAHNEAARGKYAWLDWIGRG